MTERDRKKTLVSPAQMRLELPRPPDRLGRADFIVTPASAGVLATLDAWVASDEFALVVTGPRSAGKTHLGAIAAASLDAVRSGVADDGGIDVAAGSDALVLDDLDRLTRPKLLLELLEAARSAGGRVVLVGAGAPAAWARGQRDLATRLDAAPRITLAPPDEDLLQQVMLKQFADRQLRVDPRVVAFVSTRIPRSFEAVAAFVAAADEASARVAAPISIPLAKMILGNLSEAGSGP